MLSYVVDIELPWRCHQQRPLIGYFARAISGMWVCSFRGVPGAALGADAPIDRRSWRLVILVQ